LIEVELSPDGVVTADLPKTESMTSSVIRRFARSKAAVVALAVFALLVLFALLGGLIWHKGLGTDYAGFLPMSADHPFGTDQLGHDMLALVIRGAQFSLLISIVVAVVSTVLGVGLGALAGYYGGWVDNLVDRTLELLLILPSIVVVGVMAVYFQGSWVMVAVFLGVTNWMQLGRVIRGMTLQLREKEFVLSARAMGAKDARILMRHILPNTIDVIIVNTTLTIAQAVLLEAALSFIGLGVKPPDTSLGLLINQTQNFLPTQYAYLFWVPLIFIVLLSLSVNFIGDGLRDALDPKQDLRG
jgi:peptide/nickel transport system permease protein